MPHKELLGTLAIAITFIAFYPYIRSTLRGSNRPHVFSWVTWGITTLVVFLAQLDEHGGAGAWPTGVSGCITLFIALLAFLKRTDIIITRSDWLFFLAALSSLPAWYVTSDPLWTVVILTTVDTLGFGPTARKTWYQPHSESAQFFALFTVRNSLAILALEHYSVTTVLFPAVIAAASLLMVALILYRRTATTAR